MPGSLLAHAYAGTLSRGTDITAFENAFARYTGTRSAVAFPSARSALACLLRRTAAPGSEVIVPSYTCPIVPWMVRAVDAVPVFVDSDPGSFTMSVTDIERQISPRTAAIIATHIEGMPCRIDDIIRLAADRKIAVIEDCAQALGAAAGNSRAGGIGTAGYFSFGPGKQLNTMGGGMAVTNNEELARDLRAAAGALPPPGPGSVIARALRQWGIDLCMRDEVFALTIYPVLRLGAALGRDVITMIFEEPERPSSRAGSRASGYSNLQAAIGLARLGSIDRENQRRQELAIRLRSLLARDLGGPESPPGSVYTYFSVRTPRRQKLKDLLLRQNIDTQVTWNRNCAALEGFRRWRRECPVAEMLEREVLYLPLFPEMTDDHIEAVARACARACA